MTPTGVRASAGTIPKLVGTGTRCSAIGEFWYVRHTAIKKIPPPSSPNQRHIGDHPLFGENLVHWWYLVG